MRRDQPKVPEPMRSTIPNTDQPRIPHSGYGHTNVRSSIPHSPKQDSQDFSFAQLGQHFYALGSPQTEITTGKIIVLTDIATYIFFLTRNSMGQKMFAQKLQNICYCGMSQQLV